MALKVCIESETLHNFNIFNMLFISMCSRMNHPALLIMRLFIVLVLTLFVLLMSTFAVLYAIACIRSNTKKRHLLYQKVAMRRNVIHV